MKYTIDLQQIANELDFDLEDVEMLLEVFLEGVDESLPKLEDAINRNSTNDIFELAHAIKGSSANLRLTDISNLAKEIEIEARNGNSIDYLSKYTNLKNMIIALKK